MSPFAVFFHGMMRDANSAKIIEQCFVPVYESQLDREAAEFHFCYNGVPGGYPKEIVPKNALVKCHGPKSFSENPTIHFIWSWCAEHPDWKVLYFHSKGASTPPGHKDHNYNNAWRECMLTHLVRNWRSCLEDMDHGAEMVTCHWLTGQADGTQHIPAGNYLWVSSNFVRTLPSILARARIQMCGLYAKESRYEAEVFWGNGWRLPSVVDKHPGHPSSHMC